ncbi:MAG: Crp/Fnr family transcriptional regulator [Bacteroidia bacterium]
MNPIDEYGKQMQLVCPAIQDEHLTAFKARLLIKTFRKKELIFKLGDLHKHVVYLSSGLVRTYYLNPLGEEKSAWFIRENEFVTDYPCFLTGVRSNYIFQCLEPTTAVFLPQTAMYEAYETFPSIQKYGRLVAEEILKIQQARIESFQFKSAKQRYLQVLETEPYLIQRVSLSHLASYLGMKRQSLTRIRKELQIKK